MNKIIDAIRNEMKIQGLSTPRLLERLGITEENEIRKTNRLLSGQTKRLDWNLASKLQMALGIEVSNRRDEGDGEMLSAGTNNRVTAGGHSCDPIRQAIERELDRMSRKHLAEALSYLVSKNEDCRE